MDQRLTRPQWIEHGLEALARKGPGAIKIGALAAGLKVSRGSFYWHFRDLSDFRAQLLERWRERTTRQIIRALDAGGDGPDRLKLLLTRAFDLELEAARSIRSLDRAIRAWAAEDRDVAALVSAVDAERVAYMAGLLEQAGIDRARAQSRAVFLYWAYLGQPAVMAPGLAALAPSDLGALIALFET